MITCLSQHSLAYYEVENRRSPFYPIYFDKLISNHNAALPITPLKIPCPSPSFATRSSKNSLRLFAAPGSEAIASTSASDNPLTTTGEKIFSRPRMIWRSTTCVVMLATNVFCWTCGWCWLVILDEVVGEGVSDRLCRWRRGNRGLLRS